MIECRGLSLVLNSEIVAWSWATFSDTWLLINVAVPALASHASSFHWWYYGGGLWSQRCTGWRCLCPVVHWRAFAHLWNVGALGMVLIHVSGCRTASSLFFVFAFAGCARWRNILPIRCSFYHVGAGLMEAPDLSISCVVFPMLGMFSKTLIATQCACARMRARRPLPVCACAYV